jgi:hypothetical protein
VWLLSADDSVTSVSSSVVRFVVTGALDLPGTSHEALGALDSEGRCASLWQPAPAAPATALSRCAPRSLRSLQCLRRERPVEPASPFDSARDCTALSPRTSPPGRVGHSAGSLSFAHLAGKRPGATTLILDTRFIISLIIPFIRGLSGVQRVAGHLSSPYGPIQIPLLARATRRARGLSEGVSGANDRAKRLGRTRLPSRRVGLKGAGPFRPRHDASTAATAGSEERSE